MKKEVYKSKGAMMKHEKKEGKKGEKKEGKHKDIFTTPIKIKGKLIGYGAGKKNAENVKRIIISKKKK